jgi:NAD-dependent DNA ligase (contains BRCT domain type II)
MKLVEVEAFTQPDNALSMIREIKKYGLNVVEDWKISQLVSFLKVCDEAYYNEGVTLTPKVYELYRTIITDAKYDKLVDILRDKSPNNKYLVKVGAPIPKKPASNASSRMTKLPFPMASQNKKHPESVDKWLNGVDYIVLSNKMDGMSGGIVNDGKGNVTLYSRGDGITGQDVSYLIPHIPDLKKQLKVKKAYKVRGELIIPKSLFKKYEKDFSNPRSMMSGLLNGGKVSKALQHVKFVAYTVIEPKLKPSAGFKFLDSLKFDTPDWIIMKNPTAEKISKLFEKRKATSNFEIDGLVANKDVYEAPSIDNPKNSIAFKDNSILETRVGKVKQVIWQLSKYGYLTPVILVEDPKKGGPLKLGGVNVSRATAHNAAFIYDNKIGKGSLLEVIRSQDVIPYIQSVVKSTKADMPTEDYVWNDTHVDIKLVNTKDNDELKVMRITNFFRSLGVKTISGKTFANLYDNGFNSINKIIDAKPNQLKKLPGIQNTQANKIVDQIQEAIKDVNLADLMYASTLFNGDLGVGRLEQIIKAYPDVLKWKGTKEEVSKVTDLFGFSDILASSFVKSLQKFKIFLTKLSNKVTFILPKPTRLKSSKLKGQIIVFTGFRDADISKYIKENGGTEGSSVNSKTTILLIKDKNDLTIFKSSKS